MIFGAPPLFLDFIDVGRSAPPRRLRSRLRCLPELSEPEEGQHNVVCVRVDRKLQRGFGYDAELIVRRLGTSVRLLVAASESAAASAAASVLFGGILDDSTCGHWQLSTWPGILNITFSIGFIGSPGFLSLFCFSSSENIGFFTCD